MHLRGFGHRAVLAIAVVAASLWFAPTAFAHSHVRFGITFGVGNCWRCGYRASPPVYYTPAYPAPVYHYPRRVYYAPRPVYYGYGYRHYAPRYRGYNHHRGYYRQRHGHYGRGRWHHRHGRHHHGYRR